MFSFTNCNSFTKDGLFTKKMWMFLVKNYTTCVQHVLHAKTLIKFLKCELDLICRLFRFLKQFHIFVGDKWSWRSRGNNKHNFITKAPSTSILIFFENEDIFSVFKNIRILTQRNRIVSLVHMKKLKRCKSGTHKMCPKINRSVKMPWHRPSMGVARFW